MRFLFPEPIPRNEIATTWPERKYSEKLENIRVMWRVFVQWYIFFWTINVAILQLAYTSLAGRSDIIDVFVSAMFLVLNLLGIGACATVYLAMRDDNRAATEIAVAIDGRPAPAFDPRVIAYTTGACAASLVVNCLMWGLMLSASTVGRGPTGAVIRGFLPL